MASDERAAWSPYTDMWDSPRPLTVDEVKKRLAAQGLHVVTDAEMRVLEACAKADFVIYEGRECICELDWLISDAELARREGKQMTTPGFLSDANEALTESLAQLREELDNERRRANHHQGAAEALRERVAKAQEWLSEEHEEDFYLGEEVGDMQRRLVYAGRALRGQ